MLQMINLNKKFNRYIGEVKIVVDKLNLEANAGDCSNVRGPNRAGKSTLWNKESGELELDSGEKLFDGLNIENFKANKGQNLFFKVNQIVQSGTEPPLLV